MPEDDSDPDDAAYRDAYRKKAEEMQRRQQQDAQLRAMLKQVLDQSAYERLLNIKLSNQELYLKVAELLITLFQQGRLKKKVDEPMLKALLSKLLSQRHESKISFMRK
ncbi:MAG TPA: DNA-binding protein [Candidatus Norongarragalinales archaeon]|nr:DNA-binding protein [Candidatus Norongarragalinales archaeon]